MFFLSPISINREKGNLEKHFNLFVLLIAIISLKIVTKILKPKLNSMMPNFPAILASTRVTFLSRFRKLTDNENDKLRY